MQKSRNRLLFSVDPEHPEVSGNHCREKAFSNRKEGVDKSVHKRFMRLSLEIRKAISKRRLAATGQFSPSCSIGC
jgi:hypothetical protein